MKSDRVVLNASPLIVLFKADLAHLLPELFAEILVPGGVWDEVLAGGKTDRAARNLPSTNWVERVEVPVVAPSVAAWNLGQGESEVLSIVLERPGYRAVIDDAAARRCARTIGVPVFGTGSVLVLAKRRALIASVASALEALQSAGLWLSNEITEMLLREAGE